jgi:formate hydrogenlyase transcriptional activator
MKIKDSQDLILLSISNEIARIRGKEDMLYLIRNTLKKYIHFDDSFILLYNKTTRTYKSYIYHVESGRSDSPEFEKQLGIEHPVKDNSVEHPEIPVVKDVDLLLLHGRKEVKFIHNAGIKEFVTIKLIERNELTGLFVLLSEQKKSFTPEALNLLQRISYPIAIATANIIANEEIAKREQEKTILLSLSQKISEIRSKNDLLPVLHVKLKELFPITGFGITIINEDGNTHSPFIVDPEEVIKKDSSFKEVTNKRYSVADPVFTQVINTTEPLVLSVDKLATTKGAPEYVFFWQKTGIIQVLGTPLRVGQKNIGCLIFHLPKPYKNDISTNLLRGVCAQISLRLFNLIANEEVEKREKEKTLLLSLSNEIASLKSRNDLYRIVNTRIKKLFSIKEFGVAQINEDKITHSAFMMDLGEPVMNHNDFTKITNLKYSIHDTAFSSIMASDDPVILDVNQLSEETDAPAYVHFWKAVGFKELLCLALRVGENNIGCIFFNIEANEIYNLKNNLLKAVCAQLSVAVSNILANEEIVKRENDKTVLLTLTNEIASIRNRADFTQMINGILKELFSFKEFGIAQISNDGNTYDKFMLEAEDPAKNHADYEYITAERYRVDDPLFSVVMNSKDPVILEVNKLAAIAGMPAYVGFWKNVGVQQMVAIALRAGGKNIGCAFFNIDPDLITNLKMGLLKGVCAQISVGISNIIANEDIEKREEEKTILLSLSNEISYLRNRSDLFEIVNGRIKKLFSINEFAVANINEDGKTYGAFMMDLNTEITKDIDFKKTTSQYYNVTDPLFKKVMGSEDPVIFDVNEIVTIPEMPGFVHFWKKVGLKKVLCAALRAGGKNIGMAVLHIENNKTIDTKSVLLKGICAHLSVAISNILANEEIVKREEAKIILLSLSLEIAAVKNKNELSQLLNTKLTELFPITGFGITLLNEDGKTHSPFVVDAQDELKSDADFKEVIVQKYSVNDGVFNHIINNDGPVELQVEKLAVMAEAPAYVNFWKKMGVMQVIGIPVKAGDNILGCFILLHDPSSNYNINNNLLKGVCAQISVAISNILANENIVRREAERELLLSLNLHIAGVQTSQELLNVINQKLKKLLGFSHTVIAVINEDKTTASVFLRDPESKSKHHPEYNRKNNYPVNDGVLPEVLLSSVPHVFDLTQLNKEGSIPVYFKVNLESGMEQAVMVRFAKGHEMLGVWVIIYDKKSTPDKSRLSLIEGLANQVSIALSNIISNEKIKKADEEKSLLLSFSNDIATVRDKEGLRLIIKQYLKNIFHIREYIITTRNNDGETYSYFLHDSQAGDPTDEGWKILLSNRVPVKGAFIGEVLRSEDAVFDIEKILQDGKFYFPAASFWKATGAKKVMGFRLKVADKDVGLLVIQPGQVNTQLLKGISAQLAIAIANLAAKEEIAGREKEKSMLLEFSNAIASVRDKNVLAKILKKQLTDLFAIKDYVIHALSDDKKTHRPILFDPEADFAKHPDFIKLINRETDVNDGIFNKILASDDPVSFNVEEWFNSVKPPVYANAARDIGLKNIAGIRIRIGNENIAVMNFRQDVLNRPALEATLFKSICSQLSITVSNIIANEKVSNQLFEINRYKQQLEEEKIYLKEEIETYQNFSEMIGESAEMKKVFRLVQQVSTSDSTVLILGETGTGKELVARAIHNSSPRKSKLMVKVNCAALPVNLIESELFGHERGSFTGATERRIGKFELAHQGTLFLDEIGEMPLELQVKLLRALQEKEIERVGGRVTIKVDARIITATNRSLEKLMEEGKFRSDLYYRLNIFPISLPPLRNRSEDIPLLASHFVRRFSKKTGKKINTISNKALQELTQYNWPGNIRELEHLIERSVLLATTDTIKEIHLPVQNKNIPAVKTQQYTPIKTIDENEREYILKVLKHVKGRISGEGGAADLLGLPPSTLNSRMKRLGIRKEHFG